MVLFSSGSAHAFKITPLRHLFDIEHGFLQPSDVEVGKDHRIYVLDGVNNQVKVFDEKGAFLFSFGSRGAAKGQFESPVGLTIDSREGSLWLIPATGACRCFPLKGKCWLNFLLR